MFCSKPALFVVLATAPGLVTAFAPSPFLTSTHRTETSINVSVDPKVVTDKEYKDICGLDFDHGTLEDRLRRTNYLYPKHVEVIEDFAPLVDKMVDEIVSPISLTP